MANNDNTINDRGEGNWLFVIYNPAQKVGPIQGSLAISKDHHAVFVSEYEGNNTSKDKCIANFPSQNVAYVLDIDYLEETGQNL